MGVVYEALQTKLDRKVALKVLTAELAARPEFLQRFEREAKAAAALNHPNVVQVHDFGDAHGWHYLIMEYVEGENLSAYVDEHGKLPVNTALDLVEQAAQALKAALEKSIIHRDIKPSNLMLTPAGRVKVSDLGLAKILTEESDVTVSGIGIGSPHYIAPEQADNARHVDHRADIYSLGLTLLFLLTGRRPFEGGTPFSIVLAHVNKPLPSGLELGTELPAEVEHLIQRMSAKNPDDRYQTYDSLIADLQRVKAGFAPAVKPLRKGKSPALVIGITTSIVVALGAAAILLWHSKKQEVSKPAVVANAQSTPDRSFDQGPSGPQGDMQPETMQPPLEGMQDGPRGQRGGRGGFGGPMAGGSDLLMILGPPPERNRQDVLTDGPPAKMLAEADQYAKDHKDDYGQIVDNYWQVLGKAGGTPIGREANERVRTWGQAHMRAADEVIEKFKAQSDEKLKTGTPEEAYRLWSAFPSALRNREIDLKIESYFRQILPQDFHPTPPGPGRNAPPP